MSQDEQGDTSKRKPQTGNDRRFFQQMQPTFAVTLPRRHTKIEFLDESNPAKDTIIRKKAREWVNQNRDQGRKNRRKQRRTDTEVKEPEPKARDAQNMPLQRRKSEDPVLMLSPLETVGTCQFDPFLTLPIVGAKHEHLLEYFLTGCPGKPPVASGQATSLIPFINTTHDSAVKSRHSIIPFSSANTILGKMAQSEVTWAIFLYSIVCMKEGFSGSSNLAEALAFYNIALKELQLQLNKEMETGVHTDYLLMGLSIIAAIASFTGLFDTAIVHRDALVRILSNRGNGDVLKGLQTAGQWTIKTVQWLEILVAVQLNETPKVPYYHAFQAQPLPELVIEEAARLTSTTLSHLPPLTKPLQNIVLLLHQLAAAYAFLPPGQNTDVYIITPLYDAQYSLLYILDTHKKTHNLSDLEALLAEVFHLYFAVGPRGQPPHVRVLDLVVARLKNALLPFLDDSIRNDVDPSTPPALRHSYKETTNHVIAWSLAIGTLISACHDRPEYRWFRGHVRAHFYATGLSVDKHAFLSMLEIFPTTEGFVWLDMERLWGEVHSI
ncbi:hypothetical protein BDU57DRAFT_518123 [Ampelomyces quisqualis]|uniref:Uncharacterized protein n=1 Tax=Ampelomyces quisqualis TaxID=50730 RepID=A0A6A5QI40_AMPQU|nr:hypothetical protein BDU57DRAFT_518123 [Ampelomyces quisqualis]